MLFVEGRGFGNLFAALACQQSCEGITEQRVLPLGFPRSVHRRPSRSVGDMPDAWSAHDVQPPNMYNAARGKGHGRAGALTGNGRIAQERPMRLPFEPIFYSPLTV